MKRTLVAFGEQFGFAILLSPLSKKSRSDFREDFDRSYGRFYIGASSESPPGT